MKEIQLRKSNEGGPMKEAQFISKGGPIMVDKNHTIKEAQFIRTKTSRSVHKNRTIKEGNKDKNLKK